MERKMILYMCARSSAVAVAALVTTMMCVCVYVCGSTGDRVCRLHCYYAAVYTHLIPAL